MQLKPDATKQEIFDYVWQAVVAQGKPSAYISGTVRWVDGNGFEKHVPNVKCVYRNHDGCKCAFGHLLPDDLYDKSIEGTKAHRALQKIGWHRIERVAPYLAEHAMGSFYNALQQAHDNAAEDHIVREKEFVPVFRENMRDVARNAGLRVDHLAGIV